MKDIFESLDVYLEAEVARHFAEAIVNTIHEPILILDSNLRVISVNESFYKYFKVVPSETEGNLIYNLGNRQWNIPTLKELLEKILPRSSIIKDFEINHNFLDIGEKTLLLNARRMDVKDREPMILISIYDITERKIAEEKIKTNSEELAKSNADLKQFAYAASHDLREPLRMITTFLQLLELRYKDQLDKDANEFISFAVDGAKRLDAMILDLLEYSRVAQYEIKITDVNLEEIINRSIANISVLIEENEAQITYDSLPTIQSDKNLMIRLFQNLIENSIKYNKKIYPKIHISAKKEPNQYIINIEDNGIGIDPQHLEQIFTIFKRLHTHEEYEGTGIGLALAQRIVHQHGGEIWAESEPGKGSTFHFTIPT